MKHVILSLALLFIGLTANAQQTIAHFDAITPELIYLGEDERAGSCMSPNGPINCLAYVTPPTYATLNADGCCNTISPAVKNATYCYTFTSAGASIQLNAGYTITYTGGCTVWFDNFTLYTCAPSCTTLPTYTTPYFTYSGLTAGTCYTWCFDTHMTGGGPSGGFTTLCPYGLPVAPLPIELENFFAYSEQGKVFLQWSTASETNCMLYEIERSLDGYHFDVIGEVPGHGTTVSTSTYAFTDHHPVSGEAYYRLRSVDMDLSSTYSEIIACKTQIEASTVNYYSITGQRIDLTDAPSGVYIQEIVSGGKAIRELYYHTRSF